MITSNTTYQEVLTLPEFSAFPWFILANCNLPDNNWSLKEMQDHFYDWMAESIAYGLNRLLELIHQGIPVVQDIYTAEEKAVSSDKERTKLFYFPAKANAPYVIICPGGAYNALCNLKEGFPVATRFNELGYNAFVLNYRLNPMENRGKEALMPKPMEDVAAALRTIAAHQREFGVDPEKYALAGFSSGGHLAGEWGTLNVGAPIYDLPRPKALFLGYAAVDPSIYPLFQGLDILRTSMFGQGYTKSEMEKYNVNSHIDPQYPPTYIWHCLDDEIIPYKTARLMLQTLKKEKVPCQLREVTHGGHSFGLGDGTEAQGWVEEAVRFWKEHS